MPAVGHFGPRFTLFGKRARGAHLHALAAAGAAFALAPRLVEVGDHAAIHAARHDVPGMGALDFVADPHAARAQDAAVVVHHETLVGGIHRHARILIGEVHVRH